MSKTTLDFPKNTCQGEFDNILSRSKVKVGKGSYEVGTPCLFLTKQRFRWLRFGFGKTHYTHIVPFIDLR